jgi:hypothetical protein
MTPVYRTVKYFLVKATTNCGSCSQQIACRPMICEIGRLVVHEAKEVVPNRTYDISQSPGHSYNLCLNDKMETAVSTVNETSLKGIGLGEKVRNNLS